MKPVYINAVGLWSPGYASAEAWMKGASDDSVQEPRCQLVNARHLRYTSQLTRMSVAAFEQIIGDCRDELAELALVFASSFGEIQIAVKLLDMLAEEGAPSPANFMNSVHNTVPGHLAIACKNQGMSTAIAAGPQTVSAAILECMTLLQQEAQRVALIVADESLPPPLGDVSPFGPLAVAFLLQASPDGATLGCLRNYRKSPEVAAIDIPGDLGPNPCAPALGLLQAILDQRFGPVRLDAADADGWSIDLELA